MNRLLILLAFFLMGDYANAQPLFDMPDGVKTRWASAENWKGEKGAGGEANGGRKGSPSFKLKAGETKILAETYQTSGIVRRIWLTINDHSPEMLRGIKLKMYWDGASSPAVDVPLGDFFNHGLAKMSSFENVFFSSPEGKSFNCCIPMPFRKSMKIEVINESGKDLDMFFYDVNYTIGDPVDEKTLYFHAFFNQKHPTKLKNDYEILPHISGKGRFLGTNISVSVNDVEYACTWWGEGEVKVYLDGDKEFPTLCGTGTEDYTGTGWGQGRFVNQYQGCTIADEGNFEYAFYRYHVPDPVYFYDDIKDPRHLKAAQKALQWCMKNQYDGEDPLAAGGIVGTTWAAGIVYRNYFPQICTYTMDWLGLALLEYIKTDNL